MPLATVPLHRPGCVADRAVAVVVVGPALPGRAALARALEARLPGGLRLRAPSGELPIEKVNTALARGALPVVEGDFRSTKERAAAYESLRRERITPVFVTWLCDPGEARREVYRRYVGMPDRWADHLWSLWELDLANREPLGEEIPPACVVAVGARGSRLDHVVRVATALGLALPSLQPAVSPPRRVLLVDDDPDALAIVAETLEVLGCVLFRAADAPAALAIARAEPLDVVITDQQMPGPSGTALAHELSTLRPEVRVVILTGYAEQTVEEALRTAGVHLLLAKPVAGADLLRLLEELVGEAEEAGKEVE